jgi:uncharacterized protein (DUF1697 family)
MASYVALLRGIRPGNPNMRNDKLRKVFENLGFDNVRTVISSGNVLFDSSSTAVRSLESRIEEALPDQLGFNSSTIIRSKRQLQALVDLDPFNRFEHTKTTHLNVTFLKRKPRKTDWTFPHSPKDAGYTILAIHDRAICSVIDLTSAKTPDLMGRVDREFGKENTTRTFKTVERLLNRLNENG